MQQASAGRAVARAVANPVWREALAAPFHVCAAGKAAGVMMSSLLEQVVPAGSMLAVGTHRPAALSGRVRWFRGGHPAPDATSVEAGRAALTMASGVASAESLLLLLSGGASALLAVPGDGLTLEDKQRATMRMMRAGADIQALNTVRKHLSEIKGGQLARRCRGRTITWAVSDVVGDDVSVIASGPGVPDPTTWQDAATALARYGGDSHELAVRRRIDAGLRGAIPDTPKPGEPSMARIEATIIGSRADAMEGAAREAEARGFHVVIGGAPVIGEARLAAGLWWTAAESTLSTERAPLCIITSGETTVRVTGSGHGGRNQEFALALAALVAECPREVAVASLGTDGIDGPTDAAGALVDRETLARARERGLDGAAALADNDAYRFFDGLGDLIRTGRTDTNVGDLQLLVTGPLTSFGL